MVKYNLYNLNCSKKEKKIYFEINLKNLNYSQSIFIHLKEKKIKD